MRNAISLIIFMLLSGTFSLQATPDTLRLTGEVRLYVPATEPVAVYRALNDLKRDIGKVLGVMPRIQRIQSVQDITDGNGIVLFNESNAAFVIPGDQKGKTSGTESHRVYTQSGYVYLQGADTRGLIYAIYTFSEEILGIPPLWFWASREPERRTEILISVPTDRYYESPDVPYRAWFPNDQDLFKPWKSLREENRQAWFEAMLRLKLNTIEYNTPVYYPTNGSSSRLLSEVDSIRNRGFVVSYTHTNALGASWSSWESYWTRIRKVTPVPELSLANEDKLIEFWEHAASVIRQSELETIWQVSFRGNNDVPFWQTFPDAPASDSERAAVIERMWNKQMEILRKVTGQEDPLVKITFYNEISDFMAAGLLTLPSGNRTIWSYVATRRDHYPGNDLLKHDRSLPVRIGYYLNLQFTSTGAHLAQAEGPWKMEQNFRVVDDQSPLYYSVINVGNIREFLLSISAHAAMMWDKEAYRTDSFLTGFCQTYFGEEHALEVADLYRHFFNAYWRQRNPDFMYRGELMDRQYVFQDLRYKQAISSIYKEFRKRPVNRNPLTKEETRFFNIVPGDQPVYSLNQVDAICNNLPEVIADFAEVASSADRIAALLSGKYRPFFLYNIQSQAHFMEQLNRVLYHYTQAYRLQESFPDSAYQHAVQSAEAAVSMQSALFANQQGAFETWYAGDPDGSSFRMDQLIKNVNETVAYLKTFTGTPAPVTDALRVQADRETLCLKGIGQETEAYVYDLSGRMCLSRTFGPGRECGTYALNPGVYFIHLSKAGQTVTKKKILIY